MPDFFIPPDFIRYPQRHRSSPNILHIFIINTPYLSLIYFTFICNPQPHLFYPILSFTIPTSLFHKCPHLYPALHQLPGF